MFRILGVVVAVVGIIAVLAGAVFLHAWLSAKRAKVLQSLGFEEIEPDERELGAAIAHIPDDERSIRYVQWALTRDHEGITTVTMFEHKRMVDGRAGVAHTYTVAFARCPAEWRFKLRRRRWLTRFLGGRQPRLGPLENAKFGRTWEVLQEGDDSAALAVLTPEVQAALVPCLSFERWAVGNGVIACIWFKTRSPEDYPRMVARVESVLDAMPDDLLPELVEADREAQ